jgi:hypothetical protein
MRTNDRDLAGDQEQAGSKKAYRKPCVQVYGTLAQMTASTDGQPATHNQDPGSPVSGAPHNRT